MVIQGPNGKGKTTLLLNIIQLLDPLNGDVKLNNRKLDNQTASDCFLYLGENNFAYDQMTLSQNIDYWLSVHNVIFAKEIINKSIKYLFGELDLNKKFYQPPQCMPEEYKGEDSVEAYHKYYMGEKSSFSTWKMRPIPTWYTV